MTDDVELLRRYVEERSEEAFTELVRRHLGLVYAAACRQVGDPHRAQDVAQAVFADLARKAGSLSRHTALVGWLYTSTHFAAAKLRRTEQRRRARETEAHAMQELLASAGDHADWERLRPVLDAAMHELGRRDREAVLVRFFEQRSFADVGRALGLSENAARMRVERALEKLGGLLARRGVRSTAGALSLVLANQTVMAAPGGLVQTVAAGALAQAASGGLLVTTLQFMSTTKFAATAGVVGLLAIGVGVFYSAKAARAEDDAAAAQKEIGALRARWRELAARPTVRTDTVPTPKAGSAPAPAPPPTASERIVQELAADPESIRLRAHRERLAMSAKSARLYAEFGWSPAQIAQFEEICEAAIAEDFRTQGSAEIRGQRTTLGPEAAERLHEIRTNFEQQIKGAFGEAALARLLEREQAGYANNLAAEVARRVYFTDTPLTAAQSADLVRILTTNNPAFAYAESFTDNRLRWDVVLTQAKTSLSPAQFAALQAIHTKVVFEQKRDAAAYLETHPSSP